MDWESAESVVLCNPRLPEDQRKTAERLLKDLLPKHVWLATSGSSQPKWVGLSKAALLASAQAVNTHLSSTKDDVWLLALPTFHAGGLAILARAYLTQAYVIAHHLEKWDAATFVGAIHSNRVTLTSLVPTQVHDLVNQKLKAPSSLRAVLVGGGFLPESLRLQAADLGWPLLATYAMTESSSSIAIADLATPESGPKILPHVHCQMTSAGMLRIKSQALLTSYAFIEAGEVKLVDPKEEGWLTTDDLVDITDGGFLKVQGRLHDVIKIGGENVELLKLQAILDELKISLLKRGDAALIALPDERLGMALHLAHDGAALPSLEKLVEAFHARVMPYERLRAFHQVEAIPRSALGKLLKAQLVQQLH